MRAAAGHLLVRPTGDNDETEQGRIIVVQNDKPQHTIMRGVVVNVGAHFPDDVEEGDVAHYAAYHALHEYHVVPANQVVAYE